MGKSNSTTRTRPELLPATKKDPRLIGGGMREPFDETKFAEVSCYAKSAIGYHPGHGTVPSALARTKEDFDFETVYRDLDGEDNREPDSEEATGRALHALAWVCDALKDADTERRLRSAALRAVAIIFVACPSLLGNPTVNELATMCGNSPKRMGRFTAAASRALRWQNPSQRSRNPNYLKPHNRKANT